MGDARLRSIVTPTRSAAEEQWLTELMGLGREGTALSSLIEAALTGGAMPEGISPYDLFGMAPVGLTPGRGLDERIMREALIRNLSQLVQQDESMRQARRTLASQYSAQTQPKASSAVVPKSQNLWQKFLSGATGSAGQAFGAAAGQGAAGELGSLGKDVWGGLKNLLWPKQEPAMPDYTGMSWESLYGPGQGEEVSEAARSYPTYNAQQNEQIYQPEMYQQPAYQPPSYDFWAGQQMPDYSLSNQLAQPAYDGTQWGY